MSTAANCPNCGAPIRFRWSSAVQTTCEYCRSILVRRDLDLTRVGVVGDLPEDASPVQIGTEGVYRNRPFVVVGRIIYEYERGGWNEWHAVFSDGTSGWLSDAQLEYSMYFLVSAGGMPEAHTLQPGMMFNFHNGIYFVSTLTRARYRGVQGELPFEYWDKAEVPFADLRSMDGRAATIDYSEAQPLLFLGEYQNYGDLRLNNVRRFEGW